MSRITNLQKRYRAMREGKRRRWRVAFFRRRRALDRRLRLYRGW